MDLREKNPAALIKFSTLEFTAHSGRALQARMLYCGRMLYRMLATAIVIFWLTMMGMLISTELSPANSRLRVVPLSHVAKLLFLHGRPSDLIVKSDGLRAGHLRMEPSIQGETQHRFVDLHANFSLHLPKASRQRINANGLLEMDSNLNFERLSLEFTLKEPEFYHVEVRLEARENKVHFTTQIAERAAPQHSSYALDEAGMALLVKDIGIDPAMLRTVSIKNVVKPEIIARQSFLIIHGERADTYLINVSQSGQTLFEAHVDQLGKILAVKTFFGYSLAPEDLTP